MPRHDGSEPDDAPPAPPAEAILGNISRPVSPEPAPTAVLPAPASLASDAALLPVNDLADILTGCVHGLQREPAAESALAVAAADLLPIDLRESFAEIRREPGGAFVRACRWLAAAASCSLAFAALYIASYDLYFGPEQLRCEGVLLDKSRHTIEAFIGGAPIQLRSMVIGAAAMTLCRKVGGVRGDGVGLGVALLTVGSDGDAETVRRAGWEAIVGPNFGESEQGSGVPQSTWTQAQEARKLTPRGAVTTAATKVRFSLHLLPG
jgi:hypothetical protein